MSHILARSAGGVGADHQMVGVGQHPQRPGRLVAQGEKIGFQRQGVGAHHPVPRIARRRQYAGLGGDIALVIAHAQGVQVGQRDVAIALRLHRGLAQGRIPIGEAVRIGLAQIHPGHMVQPLQAIGSVAGQGVSAETFKIVEAGAGGLLLDSGGEGFRRPQRTTCRIGGRIGRRARPQQQDHANADKRLQA